MITYRRSEARRLARGSLLAVLLVTVVIGASCSGSSGGTDGAGSDSDGASSGSGGDTEGPSSTDGQAESLAGSLYSEAGTEFGITGLVHADVEVSDPDSQIPQECAIADLPPAGT